MAASRLTRFRQPAALERLGALLAFAGRCLYYLHVVWGKSAVTPVRQICGACESNLRGGVNWVTSVARSPKNTRGEKCKK